jgi:hypothetical protein
VGADDGSARFLRRRGCCALGRKLGKKGATASQPGREHQSHPTTSTGLHPPFLVNELEDKLGSLPMELRPNEARCCMAPEAEEPRPSWVVAVTAPEPLPASRSSTPCPECLGDPPAMCSPARGPSDSSPGGFVISCRLLRNGWLDAGAAAADPAAQPGCATAEARAGLSMLLLPSRGRLLLRPRPLRLEALSPVTACPATGGVFLPSRKRSGVGLNGCTASSSAPSGNSSASRGKSQPMPLCSTHAAGQLRESR